MSVRVQELDDFRGQPSFRIETPSASWVLHRQGAGLAAAFDPDGADWIGYRPGGGSDGKHRGIPNARPLISILPASGKPFSITKYQESLLPRMSPLKDQRTIFAPVVSR